MEYLRGTRSHPTVEEIYLAVREKLPRISIATVYRNLHSLVEAGKAREIRVPGEARSRFDGRVEPHYHMKCTVCGRVLDLEVPTLSGLDRLVSLATGHRISSHDTIFYGVCKDCLRKSGK